MFNGIECYILRIKAGFEQMFRKYFKAISGEKSLFESKFGL